MKDHAISALDAINATGEDAGKLSGILQHVNASVNGTFWDDYHVKSLDVFKEEMEAAQQLRVLIDREKPSDLNESVLTESLTMLVQADRGLANRSIADALNASQYVSDPVLLSNVSTLIEKAQDNYAKGERHIQDGDPVVAIEFFGNAWLYSNQAVSIVDMNTVPKVTIISPVSGSYTNVSSLTILGSVDDVALYTINNVSLSFNGETFELPLANGTFDKQVTLVEGINAVSVAASDIYGNIGTSGANVTLDTIPPAINITGVEDGKYYNRDILPNVSIYDVNLRSYYILLNGTPYTGSMITDEGNYSLQVGADDMAGNTAYAVVNFTIDKTPPNLVVYEMTDNPTLKFPEYDLMGITDANATLTINGVVIPQNGYFNYTTNVTEGVNNFTVTATDLAGNVASWNKTRLVDTDMLPDYYEINVTYTDPLKGDTDGNGIPDDQEDPDHDGLANLQEYYLSTNPLSADTDGDGLNDSFEVYKTGTSPCKANTSDDNVSDANADPDHDGLANLQEQQYGSDPLNPDTDGDGFSDGQEVNVYHTNPLVKDTDGDGLNDGSEVKLGTDPNNPDTNGNGILDGDEYYVQTFSNETAGIEVTICGQGDVGENLTLGNEDYPGPLLSNLSGVYKIGKVSVKKNISWATVKMYYDPANVTNTSELQMFLYNTTTNEVEPIMDQGVNTTGHYYWGNVSHFSDPFLANSIGWFNQWYVNWQKPRTALHVGDKYWINANVHNKGSVDATNVQVEFRINDASGTLIGTATIPSIPAGGFAVASTQWVVQPGVTAIYVDVDPSNLIAEVSKSNNFVWKNTYQLIDTDGDGLTDYEETNGMRVAFPNAPVRSNPYMKDSDTDGLTDDQEMGPVVYDYVNKQLYNQQASRWGWDPNLYDGYHYAYLANPYLPDSDFDGLTDKQELQMGTNPLMPNPGSSFILEFLAGYTVADWVMGDPSHGNLVFLTGTIAVTLTPVLSTISSFVNAAGDLYHGDWLVGAINAIGGILTVVPLGLNDIPVIGEKLAVFIAHYHAIINDVIHYVLSSFSQHGMDLLKFVCGGTIKLLEDRGLTDDLIGILYKSGLSDDLINKLATNIANAGGTIQYVQKIAEGVTVYMTKYGLSTKVHYISDGKSFVEKTLGVDISHGVDNQIKAKIGENAADWVASQKGYKLAEGFNKGSTSTNGIDRIYRDTNGNLVIVEAKFTSSAGDVGTGLLSEPNAGMQMTDDWVRYAIEKMSKQETITPELASELKSVVGTDKLRKEFVVVQNVKQDGTTIDKSIVDSGIDFKNVDIVKIGDVVPKNA